MSLIYNGKEINASDTIKYNSTDIEKVIYNNVIVWEKVPPKLTITFSFSGSAGGSATCSWSFSMEDTGTEMVDHVSASVRASASYSQSVSVSMPNPALAPATTTGSGSMSNRSMTITKDTVTIKASGSGSGSGQGWGGNSDKTDHFNVSCYFGMSSQSASFSASGLTASMSCSGGCNAGIDRWAHDTSGSQDFTPSCSHSGSCTLTLKNLGRWQYATGGTVNNVNCSSRTKFATNPSSTDNLTISASGGNGTVTVTLER